VNAQPRHSLRTFAAGAVLAYFGLAGAGVFSLLALCDVVCGQGGAFAALVLAPLASCAFAAIGQAAILYVTLRKHGTGFRNAMRLWLSTCAVGFALWSLVFIVWLQAVIDVGSDVGASVMLGIFVFGTLLMFSSRPLRHPR
jgi:hypothetical protein